MKSATEICQTILERLAAQAAANRATGDRGPKCARSGIKIQASQQSSSSRTRLVQMIHSETVKVQ